MWHKQTIQWLNGNLANKWIIRKIKDWYRIPRKANWLKGWDKMKWILVTEQTAISKSRWLDILVSSSYCSMTFPFFFFFPEYHLVKIFCERLGMQSAYKPLNKTHTRRGETNAIQMLENYREFLPTYIPLYA